MILTLFKDSYVLDQIDLGGYIEVEFVQDLGVVGYTQDMGKGRRPIRSFELILTCSNSLIPPQSVEFRTVAHHTTVPLLEGRVEGEKLRLRTCSFQRSQFQWHQLSVNGEVMRGGLRRAA